MLQRIKKRLDFGGMRIQTRLLLVFLLTTVTIFTINISIYLNINQMVVRIDQVYSSNVILNELQSTLGRVQNCMTEYLNTTSSDSMENYYRYAEKYEDLTEQLNAQTVDNGRLMLEKQIRALSEKYLDLAARTVDYRRGRNVEKYRESYEEAFEMYTYIDTCINSLNNEQFQSNSENYRILMSSMQREEMMNLMILGLTSLLNMVLIVLLTQQITQPLRQLAEAANEVAAGNLEVEPVKVSSRDEVGIVAGAFNQMVQSIRESIVRLKRSMESERVMKEKELMMEARLKEAQLKYLQAQINPHFLFNTLNAGAQLAMMEDAERTYNYVQNVADFFRYTVKKDFGSVTLREELELVDNYIYILNVRFSGEIHFQKRVEEELTSAVIPTMTLQPIVENCVNHGIRGIDWPGQILLSVYQERDNICVSIRDNGIGMSEKQIAEILSGKLQASGTGTDSNGIGMDNVIHRLRLFYGREDVIDITSGGENQGTEVILYLPVHERETAGGESDV